MTETRSVVVERDFAFPPDRLWRALTQPHLIAEWLMKTDFMPVADHRFTFAGDWGSVDCKVTVVDQPRALAYTWDAFGLESTVTWTLTPTPTGTRLRMEQAGFKVEQGQFYEGAAASWPAYFDALAQVVAQND